jgi:protein SPT2
LQRRQERFEEERKRKHQFLERKGEGKLAEQKRHQVSMAETKRRQEKIIKAEPIQRRHNQIEDLRSKHISSNAPKKMMTNRSEASTSTLLKKRTFDERSDAAPSRAPKRRNFGNNELDICRMDEASINRNMSTIIHSILRPGRRPIYGMVDDRDDDIMEVSGYEVLREEARSSRLARKEDEDEERAENLRRTKKLNRKKVQGD